MPDGGDLTIASTAHEDHLEFVFRDTGKGMAAEQVDKLFHPFYTTRPADKGSGLGLSVCDGIVRSCGGEIHVNSKPGRGTEFRIRIPVGPEPPSGPDDDPAKPQRTAAAPESPDSA